MGRELVFSFYRRKLNTFNTYKYNHRCACSSMCRNLSVSDQDESFSRYNSFLFGNVTLATTRCFTIQKSSIRVRMLAALKLPLFVSHTSKKRKEKRNPSPFPPLRLIDSITLPLLQALSKRLHWCIFFQEILQCSVPHSMTLGSENLHAALQRVYPCDGKNLWSHWSTAESSLRKIKPAM